MRWTSASSQLVYYVTIFGEYEKMLSDVRNTNRKLLNKPHRSSEVASLSSHQIRTPLEEHELAL